MIKRQNYLEMFYSQHFSINNYKAFATQDTKISEVLNLFLQV